MTNADRIKAAQYQEHAAIIARDARKYLDRAMSKRATVFTLDRHEWNASHEQKEAAGEYAYARRLMGLEV